MTYNPEIHHRRSIRLKEYDYSQTGAYFVTVCAWQRECLFGEITDGDMFSNELGDMVTKCWDSIPTHFPHVETDEFIVMQNHIHGIVILNNTCRGEVSSPVPSVSPGPNTTINIKTKEGGETPPLRRHTLGQVMAYFKYQSAKAINLLRNIPGFPLWQRNYYEHIIRDDRELHAIREYIRYNPMKWDEDEENPNVKRMGRFELSPYIKND
ncbi:MAG: hypothetical protein HZB33_15030 [Nitrospirae bacterium]|nr:hypothetical protein [Nitrospirota bacterium]